MQPYFMPFIGYFQLIASVDKFVIYDDVSYIKGGWINRNRIKVQGKDKLITVPLQNGESGVLISDVLIANQNKEHWAKKILMTVDQSYSKAAYYSAIFPMFEKWIREDIESVSKLNERMLVDICHYIGISTEILPSSSHYGNSKLKSVERVLDICRIEKADYYINAIGGKKLYAPKDFTSNGICLRFLQPNLVQYPQGKGDFLPGLSILDLLMYNSPVQVKSMAQGYALVD